jgi:copper chaperone CopZ
MIPRLRAWAVAALLAGAARAADAPPERPTYTELPPGRYSVQITGMLCTVCARAIEIEWSKVPGVEKAAVDFDREGATVTVRLHETVPVSALRRVLGRAGKASNLGARFDVGAIAYLP